ncbi:hypothetical protein [Aquamicrobium terrae]|uniref:Uncharacterized protein n=1 Tax=Aquamicrobium terrae TaxID=1324945 RepID=A0ABV2MVU7_9HYPH
MDTLFVFVPVPACRPGDVSNLAAPDDCTFRSTGETVQFPETCPAKESPRIFLELS